MDLSTYIDSEVVELSDVLEPSRPVGILRKTQLSALESLASLLLKEIEFLKQSEDRTRLLLQNDKRINLYEEVQNFEKGMIRSALIHAKGVQKRAAALLGMNASTLSSRMKALKLQKPR